MEEGDFRTVVIHQTLNNKNKPIYATNDISTTKYSILTFLPKNLFEQFSRIANFYFLICVALLYVPGLPLQASASMLPLVFVVSVSAIREAIEDLLRWKSDRNINSLKTHKYESGAFRECRWDEVLVGDVIKISRDEQIPADMVILSSNEEGSMAYIDTCNLDGETNLKIRQGIQVTSNISHPDQVSALVGIIRCDQPNNYLYTFNGCMEYNGNQYPIVNDNVILRGCVLRNTQWVIGTVVYTGKESKLLMNANEVRTKRSNLERGLNKKLISIFIFEFLLALVSAIVGIIKERNDVMSGKHWYIFYNSENALEPVGRFFILLTAHLVIINTMIPISLYVTLEVVRVGQALFVGWDRYMFDDENKVAANSRTSNISDDLGQIEYVFSDKTGTLTRNVMEFMKCSIAGRVFGSGTTEVAYAAARRRGINIAPPDQKGKAFKDDAFTDMLKDNVPREIEDFIWLLSICHSVIPEADANSPYGVRFQASSPDEAALVEAAADMGYVFKERAQTYVIVEVKGEPVKVELLATIEFSSARKRSSVLIRHPRTGEIVMFCKGADDLVFERLSNNCEYKMETREHLKQFAADGLRTLCCAYKVIDQEFYDDWSQRFCDASCALEQRDERLDEVANEIECDLQLCGATAIEDKLQVGVSDTIEALLRADINTWIITGDKRETAINIGFACSLLSTGMKLVILDTEDVDELMRIVNETLADSYFNKLAMVASGAALYHLLKPENVDLFFELSKKCKSVICCRVSPLQKALVVKTVRLKTGALTLAIGDGANDVGMIQEADVGIGISGKEGRQAVLASDYSIGQFRFLKRLLLFHGRLNFYRNVDLVNYSFYKNMAFSLNQIIFTFFTGFSGNTLYDSIMVSIVNLIFTSAPPLVYAIMERDVSARSMMEIPELYTFSGKRKWILSTERFWMALGLGVVHSLISFFIPYFGMAPYVNGNGMTVGYDDFGLTVYFCVVTIANLRIAAMCNYWTWLHHFFIWGSILILFPVTIFIHVFNLTDNLKNCLSLFQTSIFYFSIIGTSLLAVIPVIGIDAFANSTDTITNRVLTIERDPKKEHKAIRPQVDHMLPPEEPVPEVLEFPDHTNATGFVFDEPVSVSRFEYQTLNTQEQFKSLIAPSEFNFNSLGLLRAPTVSQFSLDKL